MAADWKKSYYRYRSFFLNIYNVYKQKPNVRIFMELLLSISTISFFLIVALRPTALTIVALLDEIKAKKETVSQLDTKIANLQKAQATYDQEFSRLSVLDTSIPTTPTPETFVRQIEGLANNTSTSILGMTIGETVLTGTSIEPIKKSKDLTAFPNGSDAVNFSISVTGDYSNLDVFFKSLENMRRPIKVDAATINVNQTDQGKQIVLVVSGRIPYLTNTKSQQ